MPLIIPKELPAYGELSRENVFVMHQQRAQTQQIRPLRILILNLMPTKIVTETQLARLLANSPLQVQLTFLQTALARAGAEELVTPREIIRDYLALLHILTENRGVTFADLVKRMASPDTDTSAATQAPQET